MNYVGIPEEGPKVYEFEGDFDKYLLNLGVTAEHIDKMKRKILQPNRDEYYTSSETIKELVPLEKVIGTSRGTVGSSVYENVRTIPKSKRETVRFINCFNYVETTSFNDLKKFYETENETEPIHMTYYAEDDIYYLYNNGNHRTLTAMLIGLPSIFAEVKIAHCDFGKKEKVIATEKFYEKYNIVDILKNSRNNYTIIFKIDDEYFYVADFKCRRIDEDCFSLIYRLSDELDSDLESVNKYMRAPKWLRKILLKHCKNKRISQYINKSNHIEVSSQTIYPYKY